MSARAAREAQRTRTVVCRADEVPVGGVKLVPLGPHGVGIYNVEGTLYAIENYCPHEGAQVCLGGIRGSTAWDEQARQYVPVLRGRVLRCPWHQWEFDITTGESLARPPRHVQTYRVDVQDGDVVVTL